MQINFPQTALIETKDIIVFNLGSEYGDSGVILCGLVVQNNAKTHLLSVSRTDGVYMIH